MGKKYAAQQFSKQYKSPINIFNTSNLIISQCFYCNSLGHISQTSQISGKLKPQDFLAPQQRNQYPFCLPKPPCRQIMHFCRQRQRKGKKEGGREGISRQDFSTFYQNYSQRIWCCYNLKQVDLLVTIFISFFFILPVFLYSNTSNSSIISSFLSFSFFFFY